jgi:undecaprenyl-diphosphatase
MSSRSIYKLFSLAGSTPFYLLVTVAAFFLSRKISLDLLIAFVLLMIVCYSIKLFYRKPRPDAGERPAGKSWFGWLDAASFPSVHSARAAAISVCAVSADKNVLIAIAVIIFTSSIGLSRIKLRRHFLIDVIGGVVIGATMALLVSRFYR